MKNEQVLGRWLKVQSDRYDEPAEVGLDVAVDIFISPYDIPDGVRGGYDQETKRFVVEFRYMVDEPYQKPETDGPVQVRLGKYSRRLVGLEIDVDGLRASTVTVRAEAPRQPATPFQAVETAIQAMDPERATRRENYSVTRKVLADKQEELFGSLAMLTA